MKSQGLNAIQDSGIEEDGKMLFIDISPLKDFSVEEQVEAKLLDHVIQQ